MAVGTLGVLLAGGRGARLGAGGAKALALVGGVTLLERAVATLAAVCDRVVLVAPAGLALPGTAAARVDDPPGEGGPLPALVAGLRAAPFDRAVVLAVDLPLVRPGMLRALAGRLEHRLAVVPAPGGRLQPLAAVYAPSSVEPLESGLAAGRRAVVAAVEALAPLVVADAELSALEGGLEAFLNVNRPEDLARADGLLRA